MGHKIDQEIADIASKLEKAGERGAVIEGYGPSGKPIYQSNKNAQEAWRARHQKPSKGPQIQKNDEESEEILEKPPVSEAQRRLMGAAAAGKVKDVPASVGKEFIDADRGGKLPARKMKKAEEQLVMKDTVKGIIEKARAIGPEGLKKATAGMSESQKDLLGKLLAKAATKPQKIENDVDLKQKDQRDLEAHDLKKPESGFDSIDEKIIKPEQEHKHQGDNSPEGFEGQKIEDPQLKIEAPKDEKPLNEMKNGGDESAKMNAKEKELDKRNSSMKKSEAEVFKKAMKKALKKAMKKAAKKMAAKDFKPQGAQKEYEKNPQDPKKMFEKPSKEASKKPEKEGEEKIEKKYEGFDKLKNKIAHEGGVSNPGAVAASIGREKYGKQAFQHAAAEGKKMKKSAEFEELYKSEDKMSQLVSRMQERNMSKASYLEKANKMGWDLDKCNDMWSKAEKKAKNMKKSISWNDLQADLFASSYKRGRNHTSTGTNDIVEAQEKTQSEALKKGEYLNEFTFEVLKKAEGDKKISVNDIIEKGLDSDSTHVETAFRHLEYKKNTAAPTMSKSFQDSEIDKLLGLDQAKIDAILGKK